MADNQKYYYMRLIEGYFDSDEQKLLESMPDGYLYSNILLKLYLKSLKQNGKLMYNERIPYNPQMIATITRHNVGIVEKALRIFADMGIIEILEGGEIYMLDIQKYVGKSSTEADRKREYRERIAANKQKALGSGQMSGQTEGQMSGQIRTNVHESIEIREKRLETRDKSTEDGDKGVIGGEETPSADATGSPAPAYPVRHKYGQYKNVLLSDQDMDKLKAEFPEDYENRIERLSEYIASTGKKYKNHLATIRNWASRDRKEGGKRNAKRGGGVGGTHGAIEESGAYGKFI